MSGAPPDSARILDGDSVALKRCRHGLMLYLKRDMYVGRSLDLYGEFSEIESALLARLVPGDGVAVDAGANIGAHTLALARAAGPRGMVVAAEPQRALFQMLCANLALNEIRNVRAINAGLGAGRGSTRVPAIDYAAGGNFGGVSLGAEAGEAVPVEAIDAWELRRLDLIKADVEGMEADVLRGGAKTIARLKPVLYVEADRKDRAAELVELLLSFDYRPFLHLPPLFNRDNWFANPEDAFPDIASANLLCVPRGRDCPVPGLREIAKASDVDWL
ncbi:MAG: FkbM family methyltransferase [Rhodospirillales bacterium]